MISEKVQVLIELLKQGNGASAAAADLRTVETQLGKTSTEASKLRNTLTGLFAGLSAGFIVNEIMQATMSMERMQNTLRAVSGSSEGAAREFGFVRGEAQRLGLALESSAGAYAKMSAAAKGTALTSRDVKEIFLGVAEAGTVLNLSAAQQEGALQALQQMISKGTVQAEELRGQLGERLPGAFQIAARAMNVTTQELGKMLEQGQVISADFLPRFAAELRRTFSEDATRSAQSMNAEMNRMKTAFFELKAALGADARGLIVSGLGITTETLNLLTRNKDAIQSMAVVIGILAVEIAALTAAQRVSIATNALFGAAWLKSAADVAAATSLIATSTVSMATKVTAAVAGVTVGMWALVEAVRAVAAESGEAKTKDALLQQTEARRKALEKEIALRLQLGEITAAQAEDLRGKLSNAFSAQIVTPVSTAAASTGLAEVGFETSEPDIEARRKAMRDVTSVLNPGQFPKAQKEEFPAFASVVNTEAKDKAIRNIEQLRSLQERMFIESLQGLEQEEARIQANYEARARQIQQIHEKMNLGTEELAQLKDLNSQVREADLAEVRLRDQQKKAAEEERQRLELERKANEEMQIVEAGELEAKKLNVARAGGDAQIVEIEKHFEERRALVEEYYAFELFKAEGNAERIQELEAEKAANLKQLAQEQFKATDELSQRMSEVGTMAQTQFAAGMSNAFLSIADGSKSAKEAFADFARNFLRMVADMILQTLILLAVKSALRGLGFGVAKDGGQGIAGEGWGTAAYTAASGGMFDGLRNAAVTFAAGGVNGVSEVNSPTLFPRFNVMAGEAGREVMTVMAKPQIVEVNGMRAVVGNVGTQRLAMLSADEMFAMGRPRMMAMGGFAGMPEPQLSSGAGSAPALHGQAQIAVALSKDLEARIVNNAIEGAVLRVTQELQQDGRISASVKRLAA